MSLMIRFLFCCLLLSSAAIAQQATTVQAPPPAVHSKPVRVKIALRDLPPPSISGEQKKATIQSPQQSAYSHGDPTDQEQLLLEYINRARMNPSAEGDSLYNTKDADVVNAYNFWKVNKTQVRADFKTYPARPPLAFHPKVINAARVHSADMRDHQFQSHTGSDGSDPGQRMSKAGYTSSGWGENIFAYAHSMWEAEAGFLVDWGTGNEGLGHRHNTMNFAQSDMIYTEIGIGVYAGSGSVGPWVVTEDFGVGFEHYILGVVYKDKNNNKQYDPGEGISGVKITPSQGNYFAISSASGGYAIPMGSVTGAVTVTAVGSGVSEVKQVSLSGQNVKVDFGQATTPAVFLVFPEDNATLEVDTTKARWNKVTGATLYHVQVSKDPSFKKMVINDSAVASKDTTYALKNLELDSTYYWRVRAKSSLGWGEFAPAYSFLVSVTPSIAQLIYPAMGASLPNKTFTFSWHPSKPGVTKYWFEITRDTALMDLAIQDYELTDTTYVLRDTTNEIHNDSTYYWHVAAFHSDNNYSPFSELRWFKISSAPNAVNEDQPIIVNTIAPHPVQGVVVLRYALRAAGQVNLSLYDEQGRHLTTIANEQQDAGDHSINLDFSSAALSGLPSGAYILRMTSESGSFTRPLILNR